MAKVKLVHFEIASMLNESKGIVEHLQKCGYAHLENVDSEELSKYDTQGIVSNFEQEQKKVEKAISVLERTCEIKRGLIESFTDFKTMSYDRYCSLALKNSETDSICSEILKLDSDLSEKLKMLSEEKRSLELMQPWQSLDIVLASKRTMSSRIFIGSFNRNLNEEKIIGLIRSYNEEIDDVAVEVISSEKLYTCAVIICHNSRADELQGILQSIGFVLPDNPLPKLPSKIIEETEKKITDIKAEAEHIKTRIADFVGSYDDLRFLYDWLTAQIDKYKAVELAASSEKVFFISGYIPANESDELRFVIENKFNGCFEASEPDYENPEVPVLLENGSFASGVEGITEMYSPVSNKDIDPNPVMAFFYYAFFGLMLSDAGYGALMVLFAIFAEKKLKARGNFKKTVNMVFYSGISSIIFGALFGSWFGDLIPVVCTNFLGYEQAPSLALWLDPITNSITLLVYCLGFGMLHLFAGLLLNAVKLIKMKNYTGAVFDTIPTMLFVCGFAVFGAGFLIDVSSQIKKTGNILLIIGAVLIVLTAGRSAKNIIGKFGAGVYALYNAASGYLGDILSYSRLLALGLVTGVIASSINLLASMPGNIVLFVLIFIVGHAINIAINLIGTYVHTNRLQYVEFFSKFYEGDGIVFTPFRINSKHIIIKEDK